MSEIDDMLDKSFDDYYESNNLKRIEFKDRANAPLKLENKPAEPAISNTIDFSKNFTANQYKSIVKKSKEWGKDPNAVAGIIWHESKGKTQARNKYSNATGIIQFMPETARGLGTTIDDIYDMSFDDQLELTGKYFKRYGKKWDDAKTATDLYSLVFYPAMAGKDDSYVLGGDKRSGIVAKQNKIFDLDEDGKITAGEFRKWSKKRMG